MLRLAAAAVVGAMFAPHARAEPRYASFTSPENSVQGLVTFDDASAGGITVSVDLCYVDDRAAPTTGHKWHVHQHGGDDRNALVPKPNGTYDCASAGGHWDPTWKETPNPASSNPPDLSGYRCVPATPDECFAGDMSGKLGTANIGSATVLTTGIDTSTTVTLAQLDSHSIVIHAADGAATRIACAGLQPSRTPPTNPCAAAGGTDPAGGRPRSPGTSARCAGPQPTGPCDSDCATCTSTQDIFKSGGDETQRAGLWGGLTVCPASGAIAAAPVADQQTCLTQMAEANMLQPLLKMYTCCVSDANFRSGTCNGISSHFFNRTPSSSEPSSEHSHPATSCFPGYL